MVWSFRRVVIVVTSIVLVYLIGILSIYILIDYLIYSPERLRDSYTYKETSKDQEVKLVHPNGSYIVNLYVKPKNNPKGAVLFLHSGQGNVEYYRNYAALFNQKGLAVLLVDYRSFGKSRGKCAENEWMEDAIISMQWLVKQFNEDSIIVYGQGLACSTTAYIASQFPCRITVLENPIYSLRSWFRKRFPLLMLPYELKYDYNTYEYIPLSISPLIVLYPEGNSLASEKEIKILQSHLKDENNLIRISTTKNEVLVESEQYYNFIEQLSSWFL